MNPYKILGVKQTANEQEITKAFKAKILRAHPDHGGSEKRCRELIEAYAMVKTPEARAKTDAWLKEQRRPKPPPRPQPRTTTRPPTPFSWSPLSRPEPTKKPNDWRKDAPFAALGDALTIHEPPLVRFAATMAGLWVDLQIAQRRNARR